MVCQSIVSVSLFALSFGISFTATAQQTEEEMLAEAQRRLNAEVFGVKQKSELEIYIENAHNSGLQPRAMPPDYWLAGYTCEDVQSHSYADYRDCMYYYDYYGSYWQFVELRVVAAPLVVKRNQSLQISVDAFDEDALEDYYEGLKASVQFLGPISNLSKENVNMMKQSSGLGSISTAWSLVLAKMSTAKIELESWPAEAKKKGWTLVGKRIKKYNELFEQHRVKVDKNDALEESFKTDIANFKLLTEDNLFN